MAGRPATTNLSQTPSGSSFTTRTKDQSQDSSQPRGQANGEKKAGNDNAGQDRMIAVRDAIEGQFGLEILLKHRELRLIDQEFAKCQVALEQLRRCQVMPYPALPAGLETAQAASAGSSTVLNSQFPHAPPWGVIDGPYSRHYKRWLIPDSTFNDHIPEDLQSPRNSGNFMSERATRASKSEPGTAAGKSRSQRGSTSARLQALPHGYPEPKEEKGPMIVKRGSDGKMVKLVCLDCRRSNFNSAQGFINHCRIAHSRQFLSHDAAIEASGEEIDADAEGGVGEMINTPQVTASSALVHPLIRSSAHLTRIIAPDPVLSSNSKRKRSQADMSDVNQLSRTTNPLQTTSTPSQPKSTNLTESSLFTPSPSTPHLSALFAKLGRTGNLEDMVNEAKTRSDVDLSLSSDYEDEDEDEEDVTAETDNRAQSRSTRGVLRGGSMTIRRTMSPTREKHSWSTGLTASSGLQKPAGLSNINVPQPFSSPYHPENTQVEHHNIDSHDSSAPFYLSPNTVEEHTAPSLVSDDGDYENTHSESESPSIDEVDDDGDHCIHAELMDHDDLHLGEGSSAAHHIGLGGGKPHAPSVRRRPSVIRTPIALDHDEAEQRHVSFAAPVVPARRPRRDSTLGPKK